eukprot:TRINITY_DN16114_c0_g1_i1.p1 TRINITY_DN16114_c0_g1~~TRINITY_DN16114_c0_g1_i1.p1  ORF type:complete len:143 (+),score=31.56 TRINITY_DN16114_c0_g1_i1:273-701(+)
MQSRLVRGWCIHFPDPEHGGENSEKTEKLAALPTNVTMTAAPPANVVMAGGGTPTNVPAGASAVSQVFREKVADLFSRYGKVNRIVRMRGFLVVELDSCDSVFRVEKAAREEAETLKIGGEVLEPILTGVPKRSVEKVLARF